jgi:hypothetical protein
MHRPYSAGNGHFLDGRFERHTASTRIVLVTTGRPAVARRPIWPLTSGRSGAVEYMKQLYMQQLEHPDELIELQLPFGRMPALGIKCAIFRLNSLEALSRLCDGSGNGEIICLAFDYKPVSPSWKYKVFTFWCNH